MKAFDRLPNDNHILSGGTCLQSMITGRGWCQLLSRNNSSGNSFTSSQGAPASSQKASDFSSSFRDLNFDISGLGNSSRSQKSPPELVLISDFFPAFDVKDVALASAELLGRGTFGSANVVTMDDGQRFVVKRLNSVGISELDFKRYMEIVGDVKHGNVVALRAYYYSPDDEKLMLYDYYSNGSMHSLLYGENRADVDGETRLKISIGAARGIAKIHTLGGMLVHGNIKASNIFLNLQLYGCVSDFGLQYITKTTFMPNNATCYAPEVKNTQNVSQASDVYSFGILLLELLTRKSTAHVPGGPAAVDLVKLVNSVKSKERAAKVFDPDLLKHPSINKQMTKMLEIGMRCVAKSAKKRPKIFEVVKMLEDIVIFNPVGRSLDSTSQRGNLVFLEDGNPIFEIEHLLRASTEVLGKGTFGYSYKATLDNGNIVVVKRLRNVSATLKDFQQHMEVFGRMNHINVGRLKGYYYGRDEKLLVYDYYNQGSLSASLHGMYVEVEQKKIGAAGLSCFVKKNLPKIKCYCLISNYKMECLRYGHHEQAMMQLLQIAVGCVSIVPNHRPRISEVVKVLEEISGLELETIFEESSVQSGLEYFLEDLLPLLSP